MTPRIQSTVQRARRTWERIGPRTHDVAMILAAAAISAGAVFSASGLGLVPDGVWTQVIGMAACLVLWWRRSRPVAVTVIGCLMMALTGALGSAVVGLFSLAIRRRDWLLAAVSAVYLGCMLLGAGDYGLGNIVSTGVLTAAIALWGAYIGARRDLLASLRERAARAEAERELRAAQARVGERARIAREMHDVLAHKVSLIALQAGGLEVNPQVPADRVAASAELIGSTARAALDELRGVLGVLKTNTTDDETDLAPQPGLADVPQLIAASTAAGVRVDFELSLGGRVDDLPDPWGRTIYRVVQESLTNVHKHARGAATTVRLAGDDSNGVTVEVTNRRPVAAGSLLPGSGAGLVGLAERVQLLGGTLSTGPTADGGWRVLARLPPADEIGRERR